MLKTKSVFQKVGSYLIIGLFSMLIVVFLMPDFRANMMMDQNTAAVINGQSITRLELAQFTHQLTGGRGGQLNDDMQRMILDRLVNRTIQFQFAEKNGINVAIESVQEEIRSYFSTPQVDEKTGKNKIDPKTGREITSFNKAAFDNYLGQANYSDLSFLKVIKEDLTLRELSRLIMNGASVAPDEASIEMAIQKSKVQIKYAFLPAAEINARFKDRLTVTDEEVNQEIKNNPKEVKDPETDKARFRSKLVSKKMEVIKKEIVDQVNAVAAANGPFDKSAQLLQGKTALSKVFKIGESVTGEGKDAAVLYSLNDSEIFSSQCLSLKKGQSSKAVSTSEGIYVFTPVVKEYAAVQNPDSSAPELKDINDLKGGAVETSLLAKARESAKIVRNQEKKQSDGQKK
jgi:hypothetical protein